MDDEKDLRDKKLLAMCFLIGTIILIIFYGICIAKGLLDYKITMILSLVLKFFSIMTILTYISFRFKGIVCNLKK